LTVSVAVLVVPFVLFVLVWVVGLVELERVFVRTGRFAFSCCFACNPIDCQTLSLTNFHKANCSSPYMSLIGIRCLLLFGVLTATLVFAPSYVHALDAPEDLIPPGLNPGDKFYVMFTTAPGITPSSLSNANQMGTYDGIVQGIAASSTINGVVHISSYFKALGASANGDDQCQPFYPAASDSLSYPVYTTSKVLISSSALMMYGAGAAITNTPEINENGVSAASLPSPFGQARDFTGCEGNGSPASNSYNDINNQSNQDLRFGSPYIKIGDNDHSTSVGFDWITRDTRLSSAQTGLYAVSALLTVPTPSAVPSLSEWAQLMLALMVIGIAWHFHNNRQNSY
jgi:hypothetical protein